MAEPNTRRGTAENPPAQATETTGGSASTSDAGDTETVAETGTETGSEAVTENETASDEPAADVAPSPTEPETTEPEPTEPEPTEPRVLGKRRSVPRAPVLALGGLLVVLLIGAGVLGWHQYRAAQAQDDRAAALKTARDIAGNLTTITSDNFDGQVDALSRSSTNAFKAQMTSYSAMFGALVKQGNVSLRGAISSAGLEKLEGDTATAVVTLSTVITSGAQPQGVPQSLGLLVSLQRDGDHWLASNVEFLR